MTRFLPMLVFVALAASAVTARDAIEPKIRLTNISGDKYFGRILATVTLADGRDVAGNLLSDGFAREYGGGRKSRAPCAEGK